MTAPIYTFGPFRLDPAEQVLLRDGKPLEITPKDFGVLVVLVRNAGRIVTKDMLLAEVWPGSVIEEGNLARHIFNLRQLLGGGASETAEAGATPYIETVPKRGYRFLAPVSTPSTESAQEPAREVAAAARQRRTPWIAAAIAIGLIVAVAGFLLGKRSADFEPGTHALVTEFENQTGDSRLDRALGTALIVSLEQSRHVAIVSREQIKASLERMTRPADTVIDETVGREICQREGFALLVSPSITKTGSTFALTARLIEAGSGKVLRSYIERANGDDGILDALERIAIQVRGGVGESKTAISADNRPLEKVTTANLHALQLYSDGNRKWHAGDFDQALALYEAALALDGEFAMAHEMLGIARYSFHFNRPEDGKRHLERALALADRTTLRERRKIEANYARYNGGRDEAVAAYMDYLRLWPDDRSIRGNLASLYRNSGDCEHALPQYEILRASDDNEGSVHINMGACHSKLGDLAAALLSYERGIELQPNYLNTPNLRYEFAMLYASLGQFDRAREVLRAGLDTDQTRARSLRGLAMIDLYQGKLGSAVATFGKAVEVDVGGARSNVSANPLSSARDRLFLAHALLGFGKRAEAFHELRQAAVELDQHQQVYPEFRVALGQTMARVGLTQDADLQLQKAKQGIDSSTTKGSEYIARLEVELLLAASRAEAAVAAIDSGTEGQSTDPVVVELLARALAAAGQTTRAIEAYEKLVNTKVLVLGWEAQLAYPESHLALARLYQSSGAFDKARQSTDKLLGLWKNADVNAVLLQDAQKLRLTLTAGASRTSAER
jgi:DNA-binding winged helix-turn-helix (wHTH) protein/tetratricopeptide (TPR) repeat protein